MFHDMFLDMSSRINWPLKCSMGCSLICSLSLYVTRTCFSFFCINIWRVLDIFFYKKAFIFLFTYLITWHFLDYSSEIRSGEHIGFGERLLFFPRFWPASWRVCWKVAVFSSLLASNMKGLLEGCCFSPRFCSATWRFGERLLLFFPRFIFVCAISNILIGLLAEQF